MNRLLQKKKNNLLSITYNDEDIYMKMEPVIDQKVQFLEYFNLISFNPSEEIAQNSPIQNINKLGYKDQIRYVPAPTNLFNTPFPIKKNFFKVGHKLESIDPNQESLFCVMTVVQVCGYRIKLHFDGYSDVYDFWVNADCPNLFPSKWCEQNFRTLEPPKDYGKPFTWIKYARECQAFPAPKQCFASTKNLSNHKNHKNHKFSIGFKLESSDPSARILAKYHLSVATIVDVLGDRVCIGFDGWSEIYNFWTNIPSPYLHPVGWCSKYGWRLISPYGFNDTEKPFSWTQYLKKTNSEPVPEDAFTRVPIREFTVNMTLEVVDIAVPSFIRVAKIVDVKDDLLKILYDGFDSEYAFWIEDDSPDIHPIGWSLKTNHPLEIPSEKTQLVSCGTPGCNGKGNPNILKMNHGNKECPYRFKVWKNIVSRNINLPNRLFIENPNKNLQTENRLRSSNKRNNHKDAINEE